MFGLIDCNNFFVSCERVFNPKLNNRAVVVLSNNDGCIIARSNEAKALGIPMGAPLFQWRDLLRAHDVVVCSSNFHLYADMSSRIMQILEQFTPDIQVYSIDEAFFKTDTPDPTAQARKIRQTIWQWTGIPVSIGISRTKTLAKVAGRLAKKRLDFGGVCLLGSISEIDSALDTLPVTDIWGIGRRFGKTLNKLGITTAKQFKDADDVLIRKHLTVVGMRLAWELRGHSCLPLEEVSEPKKSITCSRAFGSKINSIEKLYEAVASFTARASEKLRGQDCHASMITVFLMHHPILEGLQPGDQARIVLPQPTHYTPHLIHFAKTIVKALYRPGQIYRKAGIILDGLVSAHAVQQDLFAPIQPPPDKQRRLMETLDALNERFGHPVVHLAAEGVDKSWRSQSCQRSERYTTEWTSLLTIKI